MSKLLSRDQRGVFTVVPTPFQPEGTIDFGSLDRLLAFYSEVGVDGLTILGQMGEAPKLTGGESTAVVRHVLSRTELPVIVGVSAPGLAAMTELTEVAMDAGAAGVMIAPPVSLRSDAQILNYYNEAALAIGTETPFALQDYPLTFSVVMSPAVIGRIANDHPNCVMVKHEDWPGLDKISALRNSEAEGAKPRQSILCGNGGLFLELELARGADGAMTGYCFPEVLVDVCRLTTAGDREAASEIFDAHLPLIRYEQQAGVGLAVRKYVLVKRGLIASDYQRGPATPLGNAGRDDVNFLLRRIARSDERAQGAAAVAAISA